VSPKLQHALEALYGLERRKDKLGLAGTHALLAALGNPQQRFRAVHVAGTNGKGSVCALIERVLREAGPVTGLYTSPHLVDFRERIRVRGRWADRGALERALERIQALPEGQDRTFFEVCTALAFDDFAARGVEWAVVEVGLGGRLDCTNVLTPALAVITSIGLDHTEILGDTLARVAFEKAGILKPGVPAIHGTLPAVAATEVRAAAARAGCTLEAADGRVRLEPGAGGATRATTAAWGPLDLELALGGGFQLENARVALAALDRLSGLGVAIPRRAVLEGFRAVRWPGRLERAPREPRLWWDGAHNPDGARALAAAFSERADGHAATLVLALSRDKDARAMLDALAPIVPARRLIATRSRSERARPPEEIVRVAEAAGWQAESAAEVARALHAALARGGPVLLTGSLFAVGEAMEAFGGAPGEQQ